MVRTAIIDDYLTTYLKNVADENTNAIGLVLGQSCSGKDYVIHFAKTPPFQSEEDKKKLVESETKQGFRNLDEVNASWIADHARQTTRMLPGGMHVLGIFLVTSDDLLTPFHAKLKVILQIIHKELNINKYLYGSSTSEKLIVQYSSKTMKYSCKTYDVSTHGVYPAEIKSLTKKWSSIECDFGIDVVKYLKNDKADWPLEKHIKGILDEIHDSLEEAVYLFDGDFRDAEDCLENIGRKKTRSGRSYKGAQDATAESVKPVKVSILTKCLSENNSTNVIETSGQLRIIGRVACKLWLQPKLSIKEASMAVKQDIMRSLESRWEMHWDSLTEEENSEDVNCVHEPPRRVLLTLPNNRITLSDYLFPGEGPQDAKVSLEELLDVKMKQGKLEIEDVEGQADITEYCKSALESDSKEMMLPTLNSEANQFMYIGLMVALIVLMFSLVLHLYK